MLNAGSRRIIPAFSRDVMLANGDETEIFFSVKQEEVPSWAKIINFLFKRWKFWLNECYNILVFINLLKLIIYIYVKKNNYYNNNKKKLILFVTMMIKSQ